jgi:hypothetical protein
MADSNAEHLRIFKAGHELHKQMLALQVETAAANRAAREAAVTLQRVSDRSWAIPKTARSRGR